MDASDLIATALVTVMIAAILSWFQEGISGATGRFLSTRRHSTEEKERRSKAIERSIRDEPLYLAYSVSLLVYYGTGAILMCIASAVSVIGFIYLAREPTVDLLSTNNIFFYIAGALHINALCSVYYGVRLFREQDAIRRRI